VFVSDTTSAWFSRFSKLRNLFCHNCFMIENLDAFPGDDVLLVQASSRIGEAESVRAQAGIDVSE
jgi:hypothetical protein